ncbi:C-type lectin domain family 4 member M-like isoform X2 [Misgurnus anguillicaudatus]|uniref:C-type lectin domain family 4 member M-like isoform X2 n=1 Tax=Misgurnus anguillicaudatus TaxID=75329 RepID=UPI003CCF6E55
MFKCKRSEISKVVYHNVLKTEIQGFDRMEMMVDIYEDEDDFRTQKDSNTNRQQPLQSTGEWIYYQSTLYYISSEKNSWDESRRYCREKGADLIIINNREEHDFIKKMAGTEYTWIGLSDSDEEGRWKWVDGSTLTSGFWHTGDPNGGRKENCALKHSSLWADYPCNDAYKCICEKTFLI